MTERLPKVNFEKTFVVLVDEIKECLSPIFIFRHQLAHPPTILILLSEIKNKILKYSMCVTVVYM